MNRKTNIPAIIAAISAVAVLPACSSGLPSLPDVSSFNPFKEKVPPLPGKRIPVMQAESRIPGELASPTSALTLPPPHMNQEWSQPGGEADNAPGHLALTGAVRQSWRANAGKASNSSGRVTAPPIVYGNRVYALDSQGNVAAFAMTGGSPLWRKSLAPTAPPKTTSVGQILSTNIFALGAADGGGYGGGLAADSGRIFAVSGFGTIIALDPANGNRIWEKSIGVPIRQAPTAANERVYVVSKDGRVYCYAAADGTEFWTVRGLPQQASLGLAASPAVSGDIVVVPYASGDVVALNALDGSLVWSESLSRTRTTSQLASLSDAATPAIDNGTAYAVGHGGRMIATSIASGERLWSANVPGVNTPWIAGNAIFVADTNGQLHAIMRDTGKLRWTVKLPATNKWAGPVLAGGTLWLASDRGQVIGISPSTGQTTGQLGIGDPVYVPPIVAQGRMFVLTDDATLVAFN